MLNQRRAEVRRKTNETDVHVAIHLDGTGRCDIVTGVPFFDHMLTLTAAHGRFDLKIEAVGDLEVDLHHTIEDVGLVLGGALNDALGDRKGIRRYGEATIPMDEALATVVVDLSRRPYLVYRMPLPASRDDRFDAAMAKEFFRAFSVSGGLNLHIVLHYGENAHHCLEAVFKALGRALRQAVSIEDPGGGIPSTKGIL